MRLAVLADIHRNFLALNAVFADLARRGAADALVDLGDRVSGPLWPAETMDCLEALVLPAVRGNHDRAVAMQVPADMIASDVHAWGALTPARRAALGALPTTLMPAQGVLACQATHTMPAKHSLVGLLL